MTAANRRDASPVRASAERLLEQQQAEIEELRAQIDGLEQEAVRYRRLFELGPEPHLVTDSSGRIVDANRAACELLGFPASELHGKPATHLTAVPDQRELRRAMLQALRSSEPVTAELRVEHPRRGSTIVEAQIVRQEEPPGELRLSWLFRERPEPREDGDALHRLTDTFELRVAERTQELEGAYESMDIERRRLEVVVQELPVAVLTVDAATEEIVIANEHARDLLLAGSEDAASLLEVELLRADGENVPAAERPVVRALRSGELTSGERYAVRRADGSLVALEMAAAPLRDRSGNVVAAIVVAHDVSVQDSRERAEREFVSNAAHQLRTPVTAIQSAIDVLEAGGKDDLVARDRFLGHIARAATRLAQLSQSLLVLARAQSGERPRINLVEVAPLLRELSAGVRPAPGVGISVRCRKDLVVLANRELLHEALASLVDNAVQFTRRGKIGLRGTRTGDSEVVVEVSDTGAGMTPETKSRMFERFYGGESGGFGLGLAIAAQAAEAIDARIDVESELGRGTVVRLTLPAGMLRTT